MKKILLYTLAFLAIVAIFFFMLHSFSWQEAYASIKLLRWPFLVIVVVSSLTISLVKATRFYFILHFNNIKISWVRTAHTFIASEAFTPLPAGEVGRALLFKKNLDLEMTQVLVPVFLQALIELWTAAFWVVLGAFVIQTQWGLWLIGLVLFLALLSIPLMIPNKLHTFLSFLKRKGLTYGWVDKLLEILHALQEFFSEKTSRTRTTFWVTIILLGLMGHAINGGILWYIAQTQGSHLTFLQGVFGASMAALIQGILVIIPGGLGVTEGGLVAILRTFQVPWNPSILITLLYRLVTLPLSIVIAILFLLSLSLPKPSQDNTTI